MKENRKQKIITFLLIPISMIIFLFLHRNMAREKCEEEAPNE